MFSPRGIRILQRKHPDMAENGYVREATMMIMWFLHGGMSVNVNMGFPSWSISRKTTTMISFVQVSS
ncbi:hypothetical protein Gotur_016948 [Gossypium turneri]